MAAALATNWMSVEELEALLGTSRGFILLRWTQVAKREQRAACGCLALMEPPCGPSHMLWVGLCTRVHMSTLKL